MNVWNVYTSCREVTNPEVLTRNIKLLAESLARQIFNLTGDSDIEIFSESMVRVPYGYVSHIKQMDLWSVLFHLVTISVQYMK